MKPGKVEEDVVQCLSIKRREEGEEGEKGKLIQGGEKKWEVRREIRVGKKSEENGVERTK
jgi:hypothetical protein